MNKFESITVKKDVQEPQVRSSKKSLFSLETLSVKDLECLAAGAGKVGGRPT